MNNFSETQNEKINDFVEWIALLKNEPGFTNRLKIWNELRINGADGCLLLEAFRRTGLFKG